MNFEMFLKVFAMGYAASCEGNNGEYCQMLEEDRHDPTIEKLMANASFREVAESAFKEM